MHLLFDLDGTLTDSRIGITRCFGHALHELGRASADLPVSVCVGPPLPVAFRTLLGTDEPALIERAVKIYRERFERIGMFENSLFPGITDGLGTLRDQGHRMRLVTGKPKPYALRVLQHFRIAEFFEAIHGPALEDGTHDKTALLAAAIGSDRSDVVMIGDRAEDIHAANINGVPSIAVGWGYGSDAELAEARPTYFAGTIDDILRWVEVQIAS